MTAAAIRCDDCAEARRRALATGDTYECVCGVRHRVGAAPEPETGVHRKVDRAEVEALAAPLALCGHGPLTRTHGRGLCRSCHRKLSEAGLPLPPRRSRWDSYDALASWARALPEDVRRRLSAALMEPTDGP